MSATVIREISVLDKRFNLAPGEGSDAIHASPQYSFAVTQLKAGPGLMGVGLVLTLGEGNQLVWEAIRTLTAPLAGRDIEQLMAGFGNVFRTLADHHQLRWLGPHKGVVHLALASITNACFDLWAKARGVPLWRLLLDLAPAEIVALLDLSYLEDVLEPRQALEILDSHLGNRGEREPVLKTGYPGYDTSVGWFGYDEQTLSDNVRRSIDSGFAAFKLKVGAAEPDADLRRVELLRKIAGDGACLMLDANQQWTVPAAIRVCREMAAFSPYWIEEPTHPDDVAGHAAIARQIAPLRIAAGEHVPNRVVFKNYLDAGCLSFIQVDCTRVGGVSEFLTVSLLARKFGVPVTPHVGDMGQIHQHLVLFNHIALGHPKLFLEHIPHLRDEFVHPARVRGGVYETPREPGSGCDLKD